MEKTKARFCLPQNYLKECLLDDCPEFPANIFFYLIFCYTCYLQIVLVFCLIGLCSAASPKMKATKNEKDMKEKRDAAISGPYTYDMPQKSHLVSIQEQHQKAAQIEYHQANQKVAPLNEKKQEQTVEVQSQQQYYEAPQQHQEQQYEEISLEQYQQQLPQHYEQSSQYSSLNYPTASEAIFASEPYKNFGGESYKGFNDFSYSFPGFESFQQMPIIHYNPEFNKVSSAVVSIPGLKSPSFSDYKISPYQQAFSYGSPSGAYNLPLQSYPQQSYAYPQQQQHSYISSYPSAPSAPSAHYAFNQPPQAIFVPQTVSISPKAPVKIPDYAQGTKGLGHYSTYSSVAPQAPAPAQVTYIKQTYEVPSYTQFTQTERPFKPSAYLGSTQISHDLHSAQSISNNKPAGEYLPPTKNYLPAKEQYVPQQSPVEYQIQYVQAPAKSYVPPVSSQNYLPPKSVQEPPKSSYLPPKTSYLPPKSSYLPPAHPTSSYLPPNNPYQSTQQSSSHSSPVVYQQYQQHQQQYQQPQGSYESVEYQSVTPSGHK